MWSSFVSTNTESARAFESITLAAAALLLVLQAARMLLLPTYVVFADSYWHIDLHRTETRTHTRTCACFCFWCELHESFGATGMRQRVV